MFIQWSILLAVCVSADARSASVDLAVALAKAGADHHPLSVFDVR
jgi:hypothetical protein